MMWSKATVLIAVTVLIGACHVGPQIEQIGIGRQPYGANVAVKVTHENEKKRTEYSGELVEVRDDGLLIAIRSEENDTTRMAFAPWNFIYSAEATDWSGFTMRKSHGETRRTKLIEKLRTISRFPQGLSEKQLGQLLASFGQTAVDSIE